MRFCLDLRNIIAVLKKLCIKHRVLLLKLYEFITNLRQGTFEVVHFIHFPVIARLNLEGVLQLLVAFVFLWLGFINCGLHSSCPI